MASAKTKKLLALVKRKNVIRSRDLVRIGVPRNYLIRLVKRGQLHKIERGLYSTRELAVSEDATLVEVSRKIPKAVICLLSALRFHEIGTEMPSEVWITLDVKAWTPKIKYPALRIIRSSGKALRFGIQEHDVRGGRIRVYSPAKTVADSFKFRHKIGNDIALEALRECLRKKKATLDELWEAAKVCRVANVMRPYMESLV